MKRSKKIIKTMLTLEFLFVACLIATAIYFYINSERKHYEYIGLRSVQQIPKLVIPNKHINISQRKGRSTSKMEEMCRDIFEKLYNRPFKPTRPEFLKNPATGKNLEIDGYNDQLKLGFEYNGKQHSEYTNYYHSKENEFTYQVLKDDFKNKRCQQLGITLINIPHYIVEYRLKDYIIDRLRKAGKLN